MNVSMALQEHTHHQVQNKHCPSEWRHRLGGAETVKLVPLGTVSHQRSSDPALHWVRKWTLETREGHPAFKVSWSRCVVSGNSDQKTLRFLGPGWRNPGSTRGFSKGDNEVYYR